MVYCGLMPTFTVFTTTAGKPQSHSRRRWRELTRLVAAVVWRACRLHPVGSNLAS
jgi:uracil DNA glycosylase